MSRTDLQNTDAVCELLERGAQALLDSPWRCGCIERLPSEGRLVVAGDLHDNPLHLEKIRSFAKLGESSANHLVVQELIHGDRLINGADLSYRVVAKVAELVAGYPGQVHPLLANHELCQMQGISVSKGHGDGTALFTDGLDFVFGDDAEIVAEALRSFFRAMPLAVRTERGLWCSHSIPSPETTRRFDPTIFDRNPQEDDFRGPIGSAYLLVWGRGQNPEQVEQLAHEWKVRLFCLGHAHSDEGAHAVTPMMVVLNSDHHRGRVAEFDLAAELPSAEDLVAATVPLASMPMGST